MRPRHDLQNSVRRHRLLREMTQQALADQVGVTRQTVLSIEKGRYIPSVALALLLARALGVGVEALFEFRNGEPRD